MEATRPTYSLGDAVDKMSILTRKIYFGDLDSVSEHRHLEYSMGAYGLHGKVVTAVMFLMMLNTEIWNLENEIRNGGESKFSKEEIAERAIKIRDINRKRVEYKNKLNELDKHSFIEKKLRHRSEK